ncbi:MAG: DUF4177 domain-containing protein [Deltaproteobacteria bacterium]|nr:DUF4177 domain-containing protein [Deltaproteobacteria bacterium]NIS77421.1 DUF4177 domain-containing protein [Deltaproteobacteria bacterium]
MQKPPYKVVEVTDVTDSEIEKALNEWVENGFTFDSIHFVAREGSRRPAMAFLFFTKEVNFPEEPDEI